MSNGMPWLMPRNFRPEGVQITVDRYNSQELVSLRTAVEMLSPRLARYYRGFFIFAGLWNCSLTLTGLLLMTVDNGIFCYIGLHDPDTLLPYYALLPQVTLFGIGYYTLSRDLARNHDIIKLGAAGKTFFFLAVIYYYAKGELNIYPVLVLIGDMIQVFLFIEFLTRMRRTSVALAQVHESAAR